MTEKRAWVKDLRDSSPSFPLQGSGCGVKAGLPARHLVTHGEGGPGREDSQTSTRPPIPGTVAPGLAAMKRRQKKGKEADGCCGTDDMDSGHGAPSTSKLLVSVFLEVRSEMTPALALILSSSILLQHCLCRVPTLLSPSTFLGTCCHQLHLLFSKHPPALLNWVISISIWTLPSLSHSQQMTKSFP